MLTLFGQFGVNNIGNDATLTTMLGELRQRLPRIQIDCVCSELPESAKADGVRFLPLDPLPPKGRWRVPGQLLRNLYVALATLLSEPWRRRRTARLLGDTDGLIVVGTGVLDDFAALPWELPAALLRWCTVAKRQGVPVQFLAVGAGPINNPINRALMTAAVRLAGARSYRDHASMTFLTGIGVETRSDRVLPDLVFALSREATAGDRRIASPPHVIGVGLMGYYGWRNNKQRGRQLYDAYIGNMCRFVFWLLDRGHSVRLLVGEIPADQVAVNDALRVLDKLNNDGRHPSLTAAPINSLADLLHEIDQTDAVIATRYHNVVCALARGRPVIAIGYSIKFKALMQDFDLSGYVQHVDSIDVKRLQVQFQGLTVNDAALVDHVQRRSLQMKCELTGFFDATFGARSSPPGCYRMHWRPAA